MVPCPPRRLTLRGPGATLWVWLLTPTPVLLRAQEWLDAPAGAADPAGAWGTAASTSPVSWLSFGRIWDGFSRAAEGGASTLSHMKQEIHLPPCVPPSDLKWALGSDAPGFAFRLCHPTSSETPGTHPCFVLPLCPVAIIAISLYILLKYSWLI